MYTNTHAATTVHANPLPGNGQAAPAEVLIVDDDQAVREAIHDAIATDTRRIHHAGSIDEAQRRIIDTPIDLVLLDVHLPDGDGLTFARQLQQSHPLMRTIMITGQASMDHAIAAVRAGCADFITKPLNVMDLNHRIDDALKRQRRDSRREQRITRLRTLCKHLNASRHEITQQVDVLCNDLVLAYQDLASQVQSIEQTGELRTALSSELDLEQVLRRTLEFIIKKIGPTNAVIFLPGQLNAFTVGGYVNYSHDKTTLSLILDECADDIAPAIAECDDLLHLTDNQQISEFIGHMPGWMDHCTAIALPCMDDTGEVLASVLLYRDRSEPYEEASLELLGATSPLLAGHLEKVIRVHHRLHDLFEDENDLHTA